MSVCGEGQPYYIWQASKKITLTFRVFFQMCVCGAAALQIGRLLPKIAGFVHTYVSDIWCCFAYGSFRAASVSFRASFVMMKWHNNRSGSETRVISFDPYHICNTPVEMVVYEKHFCRQRSNLFCSDDILSSSSSTQIVVQATRQAIN